MPQDFSLPQGARGRFAVVKLWPEIKTAEDECIARLKLAAEALGIECVEVHADGGLITSPKIKVTNADVDFVIHLHYDTPKRYDVFSIVALWNPLKFYHEWGYRRTSRNLTTHDDFISCSSDDADAHVARMVRGTGTHLPAHFHMYHSTPGVMREPSLGDGKLFYVGINWEAIGGGKSRHGEVLKQLDKTGLLRIYGPHIFQGVQVWAGYESYVREVPFDGISMIEEIAKAGIALVLSSQAHKDSALMSNRLFESVSAGALVICDENPFAKTFFGDTLLYIDGRSPVEQIHADITRHLEWARAEPAAALEKIARAQAIFRERFTLIGNLGDIYLGLSARKLELALRQNPQALPAPMVKLELIMPEFSAAVLKAHIASANCQAYPHFRASLTVDAASCKTHRGDIASALAASRVPIDLVETDFFIEGIHPDIKTRRKLGTIIAQSLAAAQGHDALVLVAPNERIYSNHLAVLAGALQRDEAVSCAATAAIMINGDAAVHGVHDLLDFGHFFPAAPTGYARFIFRLSAVPKDIELALPYLDGRPLAVLVGNNAVAHQLPATVEIDVSAPFPALSCDEAAETEVIGDYSPGALKVSPGFGPKPLAHIPAVAPPAAPPPLTGFNMWIRFINPFWLLQQAHFLQTQGLRARLAVFKDKLTQ